MLKPINIFLPFELYSDKKITVLFKNNPYVNNLYFIRSYASNDTFPGENIIDTNNFLSSNTFNIISQLSEKHDFILITEPVNIEISTDSIHRLIRIAQETKAGIVTSNHITLNKDGNELTEVLDYHAGCVRDDFYFGPIIYFNFNAFDNAITINKYDLEYAGLYEIRLSISEKHLIMNIPEVLYSIKNNSDSSEQNEKHFNYVDPKNRDAQIEMEKVFTDHLKRVKAHLKVNDKIINPDEFHFDFEASIIIPVKNRVKTIGDALNSALNQKTNFPFNIIVVDNHSSDGTTELLKEFCSAHKIIKHIIPQRTDLNIGGCWNEAIHSELCGKYSIQLDSDDLYKDENTIQKIIDVFRTDKCAMVIGSYTITDFKLDEIPPGLINHKEWTDENGMNNALRINGLGAPRAFYTPVVREINFPNVSYGEDYSVALRISREYKVGRIFESVYICRRWEGNSDHNISHKEQNRNNSYKDFIRLQEILARQQMNMRFDNYNR
jgi:hypothetical protein